MWQHAPLHRAMRSVMHPPCGAPCDAPGIEHPVTWLSPQVPWSSFVQYPVYPPQVSSIQFIVEGQNKLIVAGGWNRKVVVWRDDEESSSLIASDRCMSGHGEDILSIAYSSEGGGNLLATSGYDGRVLVWNMDPSPHPHPHPNPNPNPNPTLNPN